MTWASDNSLTGTGVAYKSKGDDEVTPLLWGNSMKEQKVPTRVFYTVDNQSPKLVGWGLEVPDDSLMPYVTREWFKVDFGDTDVKQTQIENLYVDFLTCLYQELRRKRFTPTKLGGKLFHQATIHFLFSVPATWDPALVEEFARLIRKAGFGESDCHTVDVSMTEPQAVAAFQICTPQASLPPEDGDNVLIVDAGGGTTDLCVLRVDDNYHGSCQAIEHKPPTAGNIGSTDIDRGFEEMVLEHLENKQGSLTKPIEEVAWHVRSAKEFRDCKHKSSTKDFIDLELDIPFKSDQDGSAARSHQITPFILTEELMASLFDAQIAPITELIQEFTKDLVTRRGATIDTRINYIVLAGGLGSSDYFMDKIRQFFAKSQGGLSIKTKVVASDAARLAVCMGLVYHFGRSPRVFQRRLHRVSVGIAPQSLTMAIKKNPLRSRVKRAFMSLTKDRKPEDKVDWFIKKGTPVPDDDTFIYKQTATFSSEIPANKRFCDVGILTSLVSDTEQLQFEENCRVREVLRVDLSHAPEIEHQGARETLSKIYLAPKPSTKIKFNLNVRVGLATVDIKCYDENGNLCGEPMSIGAEHGAKSLSELDGAFGARS
ncbi:hypothetical protein IL306_008156 [Fusarium sp. DS 682]|nr:hypothetical protein IL306_008156 [Fusarium sp. DS 682]